MLLKKLKFILSWKYAFLAFVLPVAAVCVGFARLKVAPFGEFSMLNLDLWGQYFPIYVDQNNHRVSMSLVYSWNGGLGFNSFAQSGYYGNSLFLLLFLFLKQNSLITALDIILILKFGFASLSCFFFLKYKFKKETIVTVGFSVAYALGAYMLAFMTHPMWTDAVILLPLTLIGLERMLLTKKPLLYCLSLAFIIFSNFYIAFSVCIFLILYFLVFTVGNFKKFSLKIFLRQAKYFAGFSLLAAGLTAFTLLPIYNALNMTLASEISVPDAGKFYHPLRNYFSNMLPLSSLTLEGGVPNIYGGSFAFLFMPLFMLNSNIKLRKRIIYAALIVFFYFSLNYNMLDYVWHGFHLPNNFHGRWSFICTFMIILICYEALIKCKWQSWKSVMALPAALLIIYIGGEAEKKHDTNTAFITVLIVMALAVLIVLMYSEKYKIIKNAALIVIGIIIIAEAGVNTAFVLARDQRVSNIEQYQFADDKMADIILKYDSGQDDFYRMELTPRFTFNPGMLYNYKGVTYYSSTMIGTGYDFFRTMGYQVYGKNVSTLYYPDYPVLNSVLNIKYLVQRHGNEKIYGFEQIGEHEGFKILQNEYYLPFAFIVDRKLAEWKPKLSATPIQNQNAFIRSAINSNSDVYISMPEGDMICENATLAPNADWNAQYYYRTDADLPVVFDFKYTVTSTAPAYIVHGFRAGEIFTRVNNGEPVKQDWQNRAIYLGVLEAGTEISINIEVPGFQISGISYGVWGMELVMLDEAAFNSCFEYLSKDKLEIISAGDTNIKCRINSQSGGLLYTSVPAEGWSVKCNGNKINTLKIAGYLLAAEIPAGESELEFYYKVPGLIPGLIISLLCLAILIFCLYRIRKSPAGLLPPEYDNQDNIDIETDKKNEDKSFKNFYQKLKKMFEEKGDETYENDTENDEDSEIYENYDEDDND